MTTIPLSAALSEEYLTATPHAQVSHHLQKIQGAVVILNSILEEFLSLEKLENGKVDLRRTHFDLEGFVREVADDRQSLTKPEQTIVYRHSGTPAEVNLDASLLHNCLINLLSNAIKYSGEQTHIDIETQVDEFSYTISITDQGIGITEDEQAKMFVAFFRAKNTNGIQGTGLGLNIVSRYVMLMGEKISFKSKTNQGTTFIMQFPR